MRLRRSSLILPTLVAKSIFILSRLPAVSLPEPKISVWMQFEATPQARNPAVNSSRKARGPQLLEHELLKIKNCDERGILDLGIGAASQYQSPISLVPEWHILLVNSGKRSCPRRIARTVLQPNSARHPEVEVRSRRCDVCRVFDAAWRSCRTLNDDATREVLTCCDSQEFRSPTETIPLCPRSI